MKVSRKMKNKPQTRPFQVPGWLPCMNIFQTTDGKLGKSFSHFNLHMKKWLTGLFLAAAFLLVTAYFTIYEVIPGKVAEGLVKAGQDRHAPLINPGQYGLKYENVEFKTPEGISLKGWWIPASLKKPLGTVILAHGVFHNRDQVLTRAVFLQEAGYQVLAFDLRGHGESGASPLSGGLLESGDFAAAAGFLAQKHWARRPMVFFGFSLGAICALRAGATQPVDAVVADSPLPNLKSYVSRRTLGAPFANLPGFLLKCLQAYDLATGLHLEEKDLDLSPVMKRNTSVPILLFSGEKDDLARSPEIQRLFDKCPAPHRLLVYIPEAGHEQTYSQYPIIYEKAVLDFLKDVREGFPEKRDSPWSFAKPKEKIEPGPTPMSASR
jgi:alpha-beta hydrolase superfamily lysophospholipase